MMLKICLLFVVGICSLGSAKASCKKNEEMQVGFAVHLRSITLGFTAPTSISLSPDDALILTTIQGGNIIASDASTGRLAWEYVPSKQDELEEVKGGVSSPVWLEDGHSFLCIFGSHRLLTNGERLWRSRILIIGRDGQEIWASDPIPGVLFSPTLGTHDQFAYFVSNKLDGYGQPKDEGNFLLLEMRTKDLFNVPGPFHGPIGSFSPLAIHRKEDDNSDLICWIKRWRSSSHYHSQMDVEVDGKSHNDGVLYCFEHEPVENASYQGESYTSMLVLPPAQKIRDQYNHRDILPRNWFWGMSPVFGRNGTVLWWGDVIANLSYKNKESIVYDVESLDLISSSQNFQGRFVAYSMVDASVVLYFAVDNRHSRDPPGLYRVPLSRGQCETTSKTASTITSSLVRSQPLFCPAEHILFYMEDNGHLHQADMTSLVDVTAVHEHVDHTPEAPVKMVLSRNCSHLYYVDAVGGLVQLDTGIADRNSTTSSYVGEQQQCTCCK